MPKSDETSGHAFEDPQKQTQSWVSIPPGLTLVATPIGNLDDISQRALNAFRAADVVLCEDTRMTGRLLQHHGIRVRVEALHDHNEDARTPGILSRITAGERMALVSDAGTPVLSDPGFRLVREAIAAGLQVSAIPGANAAITALILSGLPPTPYLFLGFPPSRQAARQGSFARIRAAEQAGLSATLVWYEAPHRLTDMLTDLIKVFGPRPAAVARELTKWFEEVRRGTLGDLVLNQTTDAARGEITVILGPASDDDEPINLDDLLRRALVQGSVKDAAAIVAAATGVSRKTVYARALQLTSPT